MRSFRLALATLSVLSASSALARELPRVHHDGVWDVEYSEDGRYLATAGGDGVVKIFDAATLTEISRFTQSPQGFQVYDVHFLPDGERVVACALAGKPAVWNLATGELIKVLAGHEENVARLAHSRDGSLFYTAGSDDYVFAWDATSLEIVGRYHVKSPVGLVPLAAKGQLVVVAQGGVHVVDVLAGTTLRTYTESPYFFAGVAAGDYALIGGSSSENAKPVIYNPRTGQESTPFLGFNSGFVWNLAANGARALAAGSSYQGPAIAWSYATGETLFDSSAESWKSLSVAFSPDGRELAVGDTDGTVRFVTIP